MPRKPPERVVVITGASNGPGRAIALEFALQGDALVLGSRRDGPLDAVRRECEALNAITVALVADMASETAAYELANAALARFKRVDVWINYAPPMPLLRGDMVPTDALTNPNAFDLSGYVNGAAAALACFKALGRGVLINVDSLVGGAPIGCETEYAEARRRVQETFADIEQRARAVPNVRVTSVVPPRTPIASETLAPMVASLGRAQSRPGLAGELLGTIERERFRVWSRTVPTHRKGARPDVIVETRGDASPDRERERAVADRAADAPAVRRRRTTTSEDSSGRQGSWHLTSVARSRENAATIALLVGFPLVVMAGAFLMVR